MQVINLSRCKQCPSSATSAPDVVPCNDAAERQHVIELSLSYGQLRLCYASGISCVAGDEGVECMAANSSTEEHPDFATAVFFLQ